MAFLGVNVDHVATVREARKTFEPSPLVAAQLAAKAGCHNITVHLREDRRHIQEEDVRRLREAIHLPLNLEMAMDEDIIHFAREVKPDEVCLVPERREEITTEGGLSASHCEDTLKKVIAKLKPIIKHISVFVDPIHHDIDACLRAGATSVELHTGAYAAEASKKSSKVQQELRRLQEAAAFAHSLSLRVNAGHGLTYSNVALVAKIKEIHTLNIGHTIVSRALTLGMETAVREMLKIIS